MLYNDLVPEQSMKTAWEQAAGYGLEGTGDYGAYIWLAAQNKYAGDDGSVMLHALTKCDHSSWCGPAYFHTTGSSISQSLALYISSAGSSNARF